MAAKGPKKSKESTIDRQGMRKNTAHYPNAEYFRFFFIAFLLGFDISILILRDCI